MKSKPDVISLLGGSFEGSYYMLRLWENYPQIVG